MALDNFEVCTVERDELIVLKCSQEETVGHALVLLEGVVKPFRNELSCESSTNELSLVKDETASNAENLRNSKTSEVFISHKGQRSHWPVVDNRFKAFVKLEKGMNLVQVQCRELKAQKDLKICFEKKKHQQRYRTWL